MSEQTSINSQDIIYNMQAIGELQTSLQHILNRLHALEEKERERARADHAREESLEVTKLTLEEISEPVPYVPPQENHDDKEGWRDR